MKMHLNVTLAQLIQGIFLMDLVQKIFAQYSHEENCLLCRTCGHEIAFARDLIRVSSTKSVSKRNETIIGIPETLIQLFENPQNQRFEVIISKKADVLLHGNTVPEHSWFPGYAWTIILCPKCGQHLGWHFGSAVRNLGHAGQHAKDEFYGLILENLLSDSFADSLLIMPKF